MTTPTTTYPVRRHRGRSLFTCIHQNGILMIYLLAAMTLWILIWRSSDVVVLIADESFMMNNKDVVPLIQTNFSGILARAFDSWPSNTPLPCYEPENPDNLFSVTNPTSSVGFLYPKPMKCASSTVSGILLRISRNVARKQFKKFSMCQCVGYNHAKPYKDFPNRTKSDSFLFSMIREPTARVISHFFHMLVSREGVSPTDSNFKQAIQQDKVWAQDFYLESHALTKYSVGSNSMTAIHVANKILSDYDYIGVVERMDESIVVLKLLLSLSFSDVLFLDAKQHGGFDDTCTYIVPSYISPTMKEYFQSNEWKKLIQHDTLFYQAVNRSLDLTIDKLGRKLVEKQVQRFQYIQSVVRSKCTSVARYPCSAGGEKQEHNCLYLDSGCAYECIDQVAKEMELE